jgi:hypothetical protein
METIIRNVRDLQENERSAAEQLVGHSVRENQRLIIQVTDIDLAVSGREGATPQGGSEIPEWWNIYEGLSDDDVEKLDKAIRQRANLTRVFE